MHCDDFELAEPTNGRFRHGALMLMAGKDKFSNCIDKCTMRCRKISKSQNLHITHAGLLIYDENNIPCILQSDKNELVCLKTLEDVYLQECIIGDSIMYFRDLKQNTKIGPEMYNDFLGCKYAGMFELCLAVIEKNV